MWITLTLAVLAAAAVTGLLRYDARRRPAQERADDLEAARLRLLAAGEDVDAVHDCNLHEPYAHTTWGTGGGNHRPGTVYTSSAAVAVEVVPIDPPIDARMVELIIDPTLSDLDVVTAVEHVAPGVGSMKSFAATIEDTRMRTSAELRELQAAELEAYAMAPAEEDRLFFAAYNARMTKALAEFDVATGRVDQWEAYQHQDNEHQCVHCLRAVKETSDEHRLIRSLDDTGAISRADIEALYAAHAATT